jgi:hypothetical protein
MRNTFPTKEQLLGMSIAQLRLIDIQEPDEEQLLQEIISAKEVENPPIAKVYRGDIPDITNQEQEAKYQELIDKRAGVQPVTVSQEEAKEDTKCPTCGKVFKTVGALRMHKGRFHK